MKNSIKILSLLFLALFVAKSSFAIDYAYNGTTWTPALASGGLTSSDSVTLTGGTWTLGASTTVRGVNLQAGTLSLPNSRNLNARVHVSASVFITSGGGNINGTLALTGGTLTLSSNLTASRINLKGGILALGTRDLTGPVNVLASSSISATSNAASIAVLTLRSGTLTIASSNVNMSSLTMAGGNINLGTFLLYNSGDILVSANSIIYGSGFLETSSGSTLTLNGGTLTIDNAEVLIDKLTFSSANDVFTTNGGLLSFNNSDSHTVSNAGADRHVNGTIRVYMDNNTGGMNTYPLGNGTFYAPISLNPNSNTSPNSNLSSVSGNYGTHYITISYTGSGISNKVVDNTLSSASGHEYWSIVRSSSQPAAVMTFYLNTTGSSFGQTVVGTTNNTALASDLNLAQFNSSSNKWTFLNGTVAQINGNTAVSVTTANISPNTNFTFGSIASTTTFLIPLPVSIIDFSAKANDASIEVKWSTATEKDNAAFVLEKSLDGQTWSAIGTINGAKNSNVVNNYVMLDNNAVAGLQYYRLKQIDLDGTVNYSKSIAVNFSKASTLNVNVFPNPAKDALNISTENNASGEFSIQILNSMGEMVYNQVVEAGLVQSIDITTFAPGIYYVSVISEGESKIIRLLKN